MNKQLLAVSYFPGCPLDATELGEIEIEKIAQMMDESDSGIFGCIWGFKDQESQEVIVALLVENAAEKAEHLLKWCEQDLSRFHFVHTSNENKYGVMIIPDIKKSIDRIVQKQYPNEKFDDRFTCLFKPLSFVSEQNNTTYYQKVSKLIGKFIQVSFVETQEFINTNNDPRKVKFHHIGEIQVTSQFENYLTEMLDSNDVL